MNDYEPSSVTISGDKYEVYMHKELIRQKGN